MDLRRAPQRFWSRFGQPESSHLARPNQFSHRANGCLDGNVRINSVLIVEIHGFDAQAAKTGVAHTTDILGRTVYGSDSVGIEAKSKLSRDDDAVAWNLAQETSQQLLVLVRTVDFGRIQEVPAEF